MRRQTSFVPLWAEGHNQRKEISDDLLRYPATISQQSAAMGTVAFANGTALWRLAWHVVATGDRRLWTGASSLRPAIRPIWRSAAHGCFWIRRQMGCTTSGSGVGPTAATSVGRSATAPAFATGCERSGAPIGAGPASDPGSGASAARGNRICRLRTSAAPAEPAGCERSGAADPANRATDCRNAAGPAAATIRRHAGRPRFGSARLRPARLRPTRSGPIRTGLSCAELGDAIRIWRTANAVGVRRPGRVGATPEATDTAGCLRHYAPAYRGDPSGHREPSGFQPAADDLTANCAARPSGNLRQPPAEGGGRRRSL